MIILECSADIEKSEGISWLVICCSNNGLPLCSHSTMSCASPGLCGDRGIFHCEDADHFSVEVSWYLD